MYLLIILSLFTLFFISFERERGWAGNLAWHTFKKKKKEWANYMSKYGIYNAKLVIKIVSKTDHSYQIGTVLVLEISWTSSLIKQM